MKQIAHDLWVYRRRWPSPTYIDRYAIRIGRSPRRGGGGARGDHFCAGFRSSTTCTMIEATTQGETTGPRGAEELLQALLWFGKRALRPGHGSPRGFRDSAALSTSVASAPTPSCEVRVRRGAQQPPPIWVVKAPRASRSKRALLDYKLKERQPRRRRLGTELRPHGIHQRREARRTRDDGLLNLIIIPVVPVVDGLRRMRTERRHRRLRRPQPERRQRPRGLHGRPRRRRLPRTGLDKGSERRAQVRRVDRTHGGGEGA